MSLPEDHLHKFRNSYNNRHFRAQYDKWKISQTGGKFPRARPSMRVIYIDCQHYPLGTHKNSNSFPSRNIMLEKGKELECSRWAGGGVRVWKSFGFLKYRGFPLFDAMYFCPVELEATPIQFPWVVYPEVDFVHDPTLIFIIYMLYS